MYRQVIIFFQIFFFLILSASGQTNYEVYNICELDSVVVFNEMKKKKEERVTSEVVKILLKKSGLKSGAILQDTLVNRIEKIHSYEPTYLLRNEFNSFVDSVKLLDEIPEQIYFNGLLRNQKILNKHLDHQVDKNYLLYGFTENVNKLFKSFHFYHDNDVFLFSKGNKDRDYTGGFMFEMTTDKLKLRMFKKWGNADWDTDKILTYQSIFLGGEGYTPYIRFTENELKENGVHYEVKDGWLTDRSLSAITDYMSEKQEYSDRPFASFQYIGRGKYRMHYLGFFRLRSLVKVGFIGKTVGQNIQAVIHQDFVPGSQRVLNWNRQIANGGRLAFNIEHKLDLSLLSKKSTIFKRKRLSPKIKNWINFYLPIEIAIGTANTHLSYGLGFTTQHFKDSSGHNDLRYQTLEINHDKYSKRFFKYFAHNMKRVLKNTNTTIEFSRREVIHNSMLEGFGIFNKWEDDPLDNEALTVYTLKEQDVSSHLYILKLGMTMRLRKMSIYYKQTRLLNREFVVENASNNNSDFGTKKWYGWGTIGFNIFM